MRRHISQASNIELQATSPCRANVCMYLLPSASHDIFHSDHQSQRPCGASLAVHEIDYDAMRTCRPGSGVAVASGGVKCLQGRAMQCNAMQCKRVPRSIALFMRYILPTLGLGAFVSKRPRVPEVSSISLGKLLVQQVVSHQRSGSHVREVRRDASACLWDTHTELWPTPSLELQH